MKPFSNKTIYSNNKLRIDIYNCLPDHTAKIQNKNIERKDILTFPFFLLKHAVIYLFTFSVALFKSAILSYEEVLRM